MVSGVYLEDNPHVETQFRDREQSLRSVIVVHTAGTEGSAGDPDERAENTASFIQSRETFGSYHLLGDTDSILQLESFDKAAYHDASGSNEWSLSISLAILA